MIVILSVNDMWPRLTSKASLAAIVFGFLVLMFLALSPTERPVNRTREAVLRTDLRTIRDAIDSYTLDKRESPHSLQDLVDAGYLRAIPIDPMTRKADWVPDFEGPILGDPILGPDVTAGRFCDVHSNSSGFSLDGSQYNEW